MCHAISVNNLQGILQEAKHQEKRDIFSVPVSALAEGLGIAGG